MHELTVERKNSLLTEETSGRTTLMKCGYLPRPVGGSEDRKEGTTNTITFANDNLSH